ncbi:hypothetical protein [Foetidibacter luteolus]|uniref:hypothetical protein n=1 Tax=Foetidibacter luteolus TaxID=2608880 RepID=UPI00129B6D23|nr:hypothetical protein [Foetidibacter luteolus]
MDAPDNWIVNAKQVVSIFRDNSAANVFWLTAFSILLHAHFFTEPPVVLAVPGEGFIADILAKYFAGMPPLALAVFYHATVIIQALRLNYILNEVKMVNKPAFTAALAYVLFTALFKEWNQFTPALITNSFLIWLIYRIARLYNSPNPKTLIYNIGLITGIAIAGYYPALPLILVVYFSLAILRPFHANEWFLLLMGIITPFYFLAAWLFVNDNITVLLHYIPRWQPHVIKVGNAVSFYASYGVLCFCVIAGLVVWQNNNGRMLIQARKAWAVLLVMLLLLVPMVFLVKDMSTAAWLMALVPAAAFTSNFFLYPRSALVPAIFVWITIGLVVYNNWFAAAK